jgi:SRSO17 transposase
VLVRVAGTRWSIETCFQTGGTIGLDEPQVSRWHAWHRHVTLAMLTQAILTVIAAREAATVPQPIRRDPGLVRIGGAMRSGTYSYVREAQPRVPRLQV